MDTERSDFDLGSRRSQVELALARRTPIDHAERGSIAAARAALQRLANPFDRHAGSTHLTGSAFIVGPRGVILLRHRRLGIWLQPGGHLDPGETPADAALREATEETGLALRFDDRRLAHVDVHAGGLGHTHLDLRYVLRVDTSSGDADPDPPPGESQEVGWFEWPDAIDLAFDANLKSALRTLAEQN